MSKKVVVVLTVLSAVAAQIYASPSSQRQAPIGLLKAASLDAEGFAMNLARAAVPAVLEMHERDRRPGLLRPRVDLADRQLIGVEQLVSEFNRSRRDLRAEVIDGVIVIRPGSARLAYLDGGAPTGGIRVRGVMNAARKLCAPLDPAPDAAGGQVGSMLGGFEQRGVNVDIDVVTDGRSVLEVLVAVADTAPAHVPFVLASGAPTELRVSRIGFIHAEGATSELPVRSR